jgi:hypothetical protein
LDNDGNLASCSVREKPGPRATMNCSMRRYSSDLLPRSEPNGKVRRPSRTSGIGEPVSCLPVAWYSVPMTARSLFGLDPGRSQVLCGFGLLGEVASQFAHSSCASCFFNSAISFSIVASSDFHAESESSSPTPEMPRFRMP